MTKNSKILQYLTTGHVTTSSTVDRVATETGTEAEKPTVTGDATMATTDDGLKAEGDKVAMETEAQEKTVEAEENLDGEEMETDEKSEVDGG